MSIRPLAILKILDNRKITSLNSYYYWQFSRQYKARIIVLDHGAFDGLSSGAEFHLSFEAFAYSSRVLILSLHSENKLGVFKNKLIFIP